MNGNKKNEILNVFVQKLLKLNFEVTFVLKSTGIVRLHVDLFFINNDFP